MQSETEEFMIKLEPYEVKRTLPRNFNLYEEYSQTSIADTLRIRRDKYGKADEEARKQLLEEVEKETNEFRTWLKEKKSFEPVVAHYYAVSLKSLLLGLSKGIEMACLFDLALQRLERDHR